MFSLTCALVLAFFDKRAERILQKEQGRTGNVKTMPLFSSLFLRNTHLSIQINPDCKKIQGSLFLVVLPELMSLFILCAEIEFIYSFLMKPRSFQDFVQFCVVFFFFPKFVFQMSC